MPTITLPYNYEPRPYQLSFLKAWDSGFKRIVLVAHRRSGKDKSTWANLPKKMFDRVGTYYYFAPTYSQGKKIIWDAMDRDGFKFLDHFPKEIIKKKNDSDLKIELINGSVVQIVGTDNIDSIVGTNPIGCVFTEYALQKKEAWDLVRPILKENGGWAVFIFTPRGMNHGWKILQIAKENPKEWYHEVLSIENTKVLTNEDVEQEIREGMPRDLAEQEFYCKFIEGAGAFFKGVDECIDKEVFEIRLDRKYQLGVDLAKVNDYTVITPFNLNTFQVGKQDRFNQIDYNLQKAKIEMSYHKYAKGKVWIDSTGVGEPIYDDLKERIKLVEPFHFTENSRKDLLVNLQILLEQRKIKIPNDPILIDELKSFRYELSEKGQGKVKICVPDGLHDDCVMSLALAVWNIPDKPILIYNQYKKEILKEFDYYNKQNSQVFTGSKYLNGR